jgi:DNA mismatch endonuclease (patch repair protein)
MSAIKSKDTKPELLVRQLAHGMGYRYRLHRKDLPGKPDLVFPGRGKVIFVHGCYWHMHKCQYGRVVPKTNARFWREKREKTVVRDRAARRKLKRMGWDVLVIWECQTRNIPKVRKRLSDFLQ